MSHHPKHRRPTALPPLKLIGVSAKLTNQLRSFQRYLDVRFEQHIGKPRIESDPPYMVIEAWGWDGTTDTEKLLAIRCGNTYQIAAQRTLQGLSAVLGNPRAPHGEQISRPKPKCKSLLGISEHQLANIPPGNYD